MPNKLTNYQCPNCNGPLKYDPKLQKLKCDQCGSTFTIEQITAQFAEQNAEAVSVDDAAAQAGAAETLQWSAEEASHMRAYNCPSCGAQLITDDTTAATACPYCGNPTVIPSQFEGSYKPDWIIPFRKQKKDATDAIRQFYKGKPFLPKTFSEENHIEEIKGVYVPFWMYDGSAYANMQYHGTRMETYHQGDDIVTITSHYQVGRQGTINYQKVPADASSKMPNDLMDSIEPFDYNDIKPFSMSYLPGFLANRYDETYQQNENRADTRVKNTAIEKISETLIGYSSLIPQVQDVSIHPGLVHYAFLPVWLLSTKYHGKVYLFAMNGQTGKMVSDNLPLDFGKMILTFLILTLIIAVIAWFLVGMLL